MDLSGGFLTSGFGRNGMVIKEENHGDTERTTRHGGRFRMKSPGNGEEELHADPFIGSFFAS